MQKLMLVLFMYISLTSLFVQATDWNLHNSDRNQDMDVSWGLSRFYW